MAKIAVLGYGTVGSGVVEILEKNKDIIAKRVGQEISVKAVLDLRDFPGAPVEKVLVHDFDIVANDPEISIATRIAFGYTSHNAAEYAKNVFAYYFGTESTDELLNGQAANVGDSSNSFND